MTQKDISTFEKQVSDRLDDMHTLDLATEEIRGRPLHEYLEGYRPYKVKDGHPQSQEGRNSDDSDTEESVDGPRTRTGGMKLEVFKDNETGGLKFKVATRTKYKNRVTVMPELLEVMWKIQQLVKKWIEKVHFCAEHKRNGVIFRSHPCYLGKGPWRDWVLVDWGEDGHFPAQIWGFLDLTSLPLNVELELDLGDDEVKPQLSSNTFAIVESATPYVEDSPMSDIWSPITLDTAKDPTGSLKRYFYVVDVDTFISPMCVIPNLGGPIDEYLWMKPRKQWKADFIAWLEEPEEEDRKQMEEEPEQQKEDESSEEEQSASGSDDGEEEDGDEEEEEGEEESDGE